MSDEALKARKKVFCAFRAMSGWERVRDWDLSEAVSDMPDNSYDLVARDVWMKNGLKADLMRYRSEGNIVEARLYCTGESGVTEDEVMEVLKGLGDLFLDESFRPRISSTTPESIRIDYEADLEGDYYLDDGADYELVRANLDSLLPEGGGLDELEPMVGKK